MYEKHGETIKAQTFLDALQSDAVSVTFTNCTIEGVVDLFSTALERDANDRILLNKRLSCIGCTFKNIVNFRTVVSTKRWTFGARFLSRILISMKRFYTVPARSVKPSSNGVPISAAQFSTRVPVFGGRDFITPLISTGFNSVKTQFSMRLTSTLKSILVACCSKAFSTAQGHGFLRRRCSITPYFLGLPILPPHSLSLSLPLATLNTPQILCSTP